MDLNVLKRLSRIRRPPMQPQKSMALNGLWQQAQPQYSTNPMGETVLWDKHAAFERDAMQQGFTPNEIDRFRKEQRV